MQTPSLVAREALASAAVVLVATAALPAVPASIQILRIARGLWPQAGLSLSTAAVPEQTPHSSDTVVTPLDIRLDPGREQVSESAGLSTSSNGMANHSRLLSTSGTANAADSSGSSSVGIVEAALRAKGSELSAEFSKLGMLATVCGLKGMVSALPKAALCATLAVQPAASGRQHSSDQHIRQFSVAAASHEGCLGQSIRDNDEETTSTPAAQIEQASAMYNAGWIAQQHGSLRGPEVNAVAGESQAAKDWCFITDGVLMLACDAIAAAPDAHFKFHAVHLLTTCLQRMKDLLEVGLHRLSCKFCDMRLMQTQALLVYAC